MHSGRLPPPPRRAGGFRGSLEGGLRLAGLGLLLVAAPGLWSCGEKPGPKAGPSRTTAGTAAKVATGGAAGGPAPAAGAQRASEGPEVWPERDLELALADLVRALTPLDPTVTSDLRHAWQSRRRETLERLRSAPDPLGAGLLARLQEAPEDDALLRDGLLTGATWAAPTLLEPVLFEALEDYRGGRIRAELGLRARCAELLAEVAPEKLATLLEKVLGDGIPTATWPREEMLLGAYLSAVDRLARDPLPLLTSVATDIRMEAAARNRAVKELGSRCAPLGLAALRTVLTESTGDRYLRRLAAQSLIACLPPEQAAAEIQGVLELEADPGMQQFLSSALDQLALRLGSAGR
jgi:hypothetical protein